MEINEELSKPYDEWWSNRTPENTNCKDYVLIAKKNTLKICY